MKCYACGYEKRQPKYVTVADVVRYRSGKRKGEIESVDEQKIDIYGDDSKFIELSMPNGHALTVMDNNDDRSYSYWCNDDTNTTRTLYAYPRCGTVKFVDDSDLF